MSDTKKRPLFVDISDLENKLDEIIEIKRFGISAIETIKNELRSFHSEYYNQIQKKQSDFLMALDNFSNNFKETIDLKSDNIFLKERIRQLAKEIKKLKNES